MKAFLIIVCLLLLSGLLLSACADGIVLSPTKPLGESVITLPTAEPTPVPSPSNLLEHVQFQVDKTMTLARSQRGLIWPLFLVILVLGGFIKLLQWIYGLTTSSPPLS